MATTAHAGGLVLPERGVRELSQAGALVAGADDPAALWDDPAGLAHLAGDGHRALLFDVALVYQDVDYTAPGTAGALSNHQPGSPIPTIAGALGVGDDLVIAGGIAAPYAPSHSFDAGGPERYASTELAASSFVMVTAGAAYRVSPRLRVGATVMDVVSTITAKMTLWDCPGARACTPGDASFDAPSEIDQTDYVSPSGAVGVQWDATDTLVVGATLAAPIRISGTGTLKTQPPSSTALMGGKLTGDQASLRFWLPPSARAGVSWHDRTTRVEAAVDVELWSIHDEVEIVPSGVRIDQSAAGSFAFAPMVIPRSYKTSVAVSVGGEQRVGDGVIGAGVGLETAAAPANDVSVLTVDAPKLLIGLGGAYAAGGWRIGASIGYAHLADVDVTAGTAPVLQPIRTAPPFIAANDGSYRSFYLLGGLRAARDF